MLVRPSYPVGFNGYPGHSQISNLLVITKMVLSSKSFLTNITFERSFICMSSFVDHQIVALGKFSFAKSKQL